MKTRNSSFGEPFPPSSWPMVVGGWGEPIVHKIAKRYLPVAQAKLEPKGPREGRGGDCRTTRGAHQGKRLLIIPCHFGPAALRRQGAETSPPPPCYALEQRFAPCALDNAQCRELQCIPRSPRGVNERGSRVGKRELENSSRHPAVAALCNPPPWRGAPLAFHKERCTSHLVHEEHFDALSMATFSEGNGVVEKMCVSLLKRS